MADIFVSYARGDAEDAELLKDALGTAAPDRTVWWDQQIQIGEQWLPVIEEELDQARCVVVMWSKHSKKSEFVHREARRRFDDGIVVQVLLDETVPPGEFDGEQAASLEGWDKSPNSIVLKPLLQRIQTLLSTVTIVPTGVALVVGDPSTHPDMVPTINLDVTLTNDSDNLLRLYDLALDVVRVPDGGEDKPPAVVEMNWHLWYEPEGLEHVLEERDDDEWTVEVPPHREWAKGVQFRTRRRKPSPLWAAGTYWCEMRGWTDRSTREPANVKTVFDFGAIPSRVEAMASWLREPTDWWDQWSNRARGMPAPFTVTHVG